MSATVAQATEAADGGFHVDLFVRRYSRETRPWIMFHQDVANITINVALSNDCDHEGGRLHAIIGGRHQTIGREEGEATAHADDVMHAVSAMRSGVRYSLIMFFFSLKNDESSIEFQTIPKRELDAARAPRPHEASAEPEEACGLVLCDADGRTTWMWAGRRDAAPPRPAAEMQPCAGAGRRDAAPPHTPVTCDAVMAFARAE